MLPFTGGQELTLAEVLEQIRIAAIDHRIEGITLLGGEPLAHAAEAAALARETRRLGLTVMVFSGYTLEEIRRSANTMVHELLTHTDILVDGPYLRGLPEQRRRWIGSSNQQVYFLSGRYTPGDPCWRMRNTLEIKLRGAELTVNGFPAPAASAVWRRPIRRG
jgi:anaerobic ribonucleoside-triphosphate reductase activating protein